MCGVLNTVSVSLYAKAVLIARFRYIYIYGRLLVTFFDMSKRYERNEKMYFSCGKVSVAKRCRFLYQSIIVFQEWLGAIFD